MHQSENIKAIQKALWRWASGEAAGEETLKAVVRICTQAAWFYRVAYLKNGAVQGIR